jgi:hypothetical protein
MKWIKQNEWNLVVAVAFLSFVCGIFGVNDTLLMSGKSAPWPDLVYFSIRLFFFNYDLPGDGIPYAPGTPLLQVARFLAPATVTYAAVKGFMLGAAAVLNIWQLRRWQGHTVVCGAGKRGREVALALKADGRKVVVIEKDAEAETLGELRAAGVRVVLGSATDPIHQEQARMNYAGLVVALTNTDESNLEIAMAAANGPTNQPVDILAHASRQFAAVFDHQPPVDNTNSRGRPRFFNHETSAARLLVQEFTANLATVLSQKPRSPRVLLIGDGSLIPELLGIAMVQCQYAYSDIPQFVVVVPDRNLVARSFPTLHPQLYLVADVSLIERTCAEIATLELQSITSEQDFDLIFVSYQNDLDALSLARHLAQQKPSGLVGRIVACLRPSTDLARHSISIEDTEIRNLVKLGCVSDVLLHGALDREARAIHEAYVAEEKAKGLIPIENPALVSWEDLPESLRQANRAQADHIPIKQRALAVSRSEQMLEALAEAEHRRWMAEKILAGWRFGEKRDNSRKLHPSINIYSQLTEAEKQKDRDTVQSVLQRMESLT